MTGEHLAIIILAVVLILVFYFWRADHWAFAEERKELMDRIQAPEQVARNAALREKMYVGPSWRPTARRPQEPEGEEEEDESSDTAGLTPEVYGDTMEVESVARAGRVEYLGED